MVAYQEGESFVCLRGRLQVSTPGWNNVQYSSLVLKAHQSAVSIMRHR